MNNELIINGITYVRKEEPKAEEPRRREFVICNSTSIMTVDCRNLRVTGSNGSVYPLEGIEVVELKDGERVLSRDEINEVLHGYCNGDEAAILKELGFDK
jgi:hypothetical protein